MFKNYDKVFRFTFKNQAGTGSYKTGTAVFGLILFLLPVIIFGIIGVVRSKDTGLKPCNADRVLVINPLNPEADFNILNSTGFEDYTSIAYSNVSSVEAALETVKEKGYKNTLVLEFVPDETAATLCTVIPEGSDITKKQAKNFDKFLQNNRNLCAILASGASLEDMASLYAVTETDIYNTSGYNNGVSLLSDTSALNDQINAQIRPIFNMVLVYAITMIMYFIIIVYGNSIMQNVVLEKGNKLMDTMLISLKPQAMILGKLLGVLSAALLQFFIWVACLFFGLFASVKVYKFICPERPLGIVTFFESFKELGIFTPGAIVIALLVLLFGIIFYAAIAGICGAISSSKEEAAANQGLFMGVLLVSFYIVLFGGIKSTGASAWMYIFPGTGSMLLPAGICTGTVSNTVALISLVVMILSTVLLIFLAGKLYTMMALYKGNKVNLSKALKMLFGR
ncbi:MAG: ABC transporter permease [Lachnospiraceae bacterium]|nr:ABC transporter permease [Lachnospiraceae bacterium]